MNLSNGLPEIEITDDFTEGEIIHKGIKFTLTRIGNSDSFLLKGTLLIPKDKPELAFKSRSSSTTLQHIKQLSVVSNIIINQLLNDE